MPEHQLLRQVGERQRTNSAATRIQAEIETQRAHPQIPVSNFGPTTHHKLRDPKLSDGSCADTM